MPVKELPREQWEPYFNKLSQNLQAVEASLEVVDKETGDQVEVECAPLRGISYDPKYNVFEILFGEKHDHLIYNPERVYVNEENGKITQIEVINKDETRYILTMKPALPFPD